MKNKTPHLEIIVIVWVRGRKTVFLAHTLRILVWPQLWISTCVTTPYRGAALEKDETSCPPESFYASVTNHIKSSECVMNMYMHVWNISNHLNLVFSVQVFNLLYSIIREYRGLWGLIYYKGKLCMHCHSCQPTDFPQAKWI